MIWPILSDDPLTGPRPIRRQLRPQSAAEVVSASDYPGAASRIAEACGSWGGAYTLLLPADSNGISARWLDLLRASLVDHTSAAGIVPPDMGRENSLGGGLWIEGIARRDLLLSVLARAPGADAGWRPVQVADGLQDSDPWNLAYTGVLGLLPAAPSADELRAASLRDGLQYSDLLTLKPVDVEPGPVDLLNRLRSEDTTASQLSCVLLNRFGAPRGRQFDQEPLLAHKWQRAADIGPNIVIVYEPGSVEDLALLWHLRAVHALPRGFPLAVPASADVPEALGAWTRELAMTLWGFRGPDCVLVSASVSLAQLESWASETTLFTAVEPEVVLQPAYGCGLRSMDIAHFEGGQARLASFVATETAALGQELLEEHGGWLRLNVTALGRRLPDSPTMRSDRHGSFAHGGVDVGVSSRRETVAIRYPSGLDVLDAIARDVGLRCRPSAPGLAAEHFVRLIGGLDGLDYFMSPMSAELLGLLSRRRGMTELRRRLNAFLAEDAVAESDAEKRDRASVLEQRLSDAIGLPRPEDTAGVTHPAARQALGDTGAANAWLRWALSHRLILRGVTIRCATCGLKQWRQLREAQSELPCHGCGAPIADPFGVDAVHFSYRASEALLRALDTDVLVHLLSVRFMWRLFEPSFNDDGLIVGGYPGVEFFTPGDPNPIAEVDVVLVLADGGLVLGECKTTARGLSRDVLDKLWSLADRTNANLTFVATLARASDCHPIWQTTDGRRHVSLTAEHLYERYPMAALGQDPFAWREQFQATPGRSVTGTEFANDYRQGLRDRDYWERRWRRASWRQDE